jgi:hypothetical protein
VGRKELEALVAIKRLKVEAPSRVEYDGMLKAARSSLADAQKDLEDDSTFTLAYGAAHRLALAALRREGFRSEDRISVFQTLAHTVQAAPADIQIFLKAHNERNLAEYEGRVDVDEKLLTDLIRCTKALEAKVAKLTPPK